MASMEAAGGRSSLRPRKIRRNARTRPSSAEDDNPAVHVRGKDLPLVTARRDGHSDT